MATAGLRRGAVRARGMGVTTLLVALAVTLAACSSGPSFDKTAAPGLISQAYSTLFNFSNSNLSGKVADIQGGSTVSASLEAALKSPLASQATGAKVGSTSFPSDASCTSAKVPTPCAQVKYDILGSGGSAILAGQKGYAAYSNGKWLVAKVTICALLGLFYSAEGKTGSPPGC